MGSKLSGNYSHGMWNTKIYKVWDGMKQRCKNPKTLWYKIYGGKGISVCKERERFEGFYKDMGGTYCEGLQIDRIDGNGNYCKDNCKRVTPKENSRHTSRSKLYNGKCLSQWCEELGLKYKCIESRMRRGIPMKEALGL